MADAATELLKVPAKPVETILEILAALRHRARTGEDVQVPLATFHLGNGHAFTGWLLSYGEERGRRTLLVRLTGPDPRWPSLDGVYLDPHAVAALTVHDLGNQAHLFSFGAVTMPPGAEAPTKLALRRSAEEASKQLLAATGVALEIAWEGMPDTDEARYHLAALVAAARGAVEAVAADPMGKEALSRRVKKVRLTHADERGCSLAGDALEVRAALDSGRSYVKDALREAMEKVL